MTQKKENLKLSIDQIKGNNWKKYLDFEYSYSNNCIFNKTNVENSSNLLNASQLQYFTNNVEYNFNGNLTGHHTGKKHPRSSFDDSPEIIQSKYQRKSDSVIDISPEEIRHIAYSNVHKYSNGITEKPKTLNDWIEHCNDVIKNPKPYEMKRIIPNSCTNETKANSPVFQSTIITSKSFPNPNIKLSDSKMDELYPISKGEIHKISEENTEIDLNTQLPSKSSQSATIINCPLSNTYGARLLTKMGWRFGEGLGKDSDGIVRAVRFETKIDRLGIAAPTEKYQSKIKKVDPEKNPVSVLMEFCQKSKLSPPVYTDVEEVGPSNNRKFRISVTILNKTYVSAEFYKTKKEARAGSASIAAKELNLM